MNWEQIRTILWLRWRLTKNQWARGGQFNAILMMIVVFCCIFISFSGFFIGLLIGIGAFGMTKVSPGALLLIWDFITGAFLFFLLVGVIEEIQRSETIDIGRIMYLPVSLKEIFLLNYFASYLTLSIILFLPAMLGISLGLALSRGFSMLLMVPLVLGFVFMITSWTYCLRGWMVRLMINKRRRRAIIAGITVALILISQLPYLLTNVLPHHYENRQRSVRQAPSEPQIDVTSVAQSLERNSVLLTVHKVVPLLWVSYGVMSLADGSIWPAFFGLAGLLLLGGLGLRRAYRGTVRFYQGQTESKRIKRAPEKEKTAIAKGGLLERPLAGPLQEALVLAIVFFRSLKRAPEVKLVLVNNMIILAVLGGTFIFRRSVAVSDEFKPFVISGVAVFTFFGMLQLFFNQFGFDRYGFRTLVLLPVQRKYILLGKNLALIPVVVIIGLIFLTIVKFLLDVRLIVVLAALVQSAAAYLLLSMAGNLTSVLVPYRIAPGSLKPTKLTPLMTFKVFLTHLLFPMLMFPLFIPPALGLLFASLSGLSAISVNLLVSVIILVILVFFYRFSLKSFGSLLQQQEKNILQIVTQEVE